MPNFASHFLKLASSHRTLSMSFPLPVSHSLSQFHVSIFVNGRHWLVLLAQNWPFQKPKKPDVQHCNFLFLSPWKAPETKWKFLFIRSFSPSRAVAFWAFPCVSVSHKFRHRKLSPYSNWKCKIDGNYGPASFSFQCVATGSSGQHFRSLLQLTDCCRCCLQYGKMGVGCKLRWCHLRRTLIN